MSPLREQAIDEIVTLSDAQIRFLLKIIDGLKSLAMPETNTNDPFYAPENQHFIEEGIKALDDGKGEVHDLIEV